MNPGQGSRHRLQVGVDRGGLDRHVCRVGRSLGLEPIGIQQGYPAVSEIVCVSCHDRQVMQQGDGSDLFVDPMLRIRHPQPPPQLGSIAIQAENTIALAEQHLLQPLLQKLGLLLITPMPDQLNTTPQLTDRHAGQKDRRVVAGCL